MPSPAQDPKVSNCCCGKFGERPQLPSARRLVGLGWSSTTDGAAHGQAHWQYSQNDSACAPTPVTGSTSALPLGGWRPQLFGGMPPQYFIQFLFFRISPHAKWRDWQVPRNERTRGNTAVHCDSYRCATMGHGDERGVSEPWPLRAKLQCGSRGTSRHRQIQVASPRSHGAQRWVLRRERAQS